MSDELHFLGAAELSRRFGRRELSPVEVVEALLQRTERLDPGLGAFVHVAGDSALDEARRSEALLAKGEARGPLEGVPIGIKDLLDTADQPTAAGSRVLDGRRPRADAAVVARLRAAGAVILGKLSLHEFAFGITSLNPHLKPCRNPWDRGRVPGGSSGGNGVALAAGLVPIAIGTDTGGSIRIPASACGVAGLKPTFGRVSRAGVIPLSLSLDHVGPMARTVEDLGLALEAIAGHDPADPWSAASPKAPPPRGGARGASGLRLGVPQALLQGLQPAVARAFEDALFALERLGARRRVVTLRAIESVYTTTFAMIAAEAAAFHREWLAARPGDYGEDVRRNLAIGLCLDDAEVLAAMRWKELFAAELAATFDEVDAIVLPTLPRTALRTSEAVSREPHEAWNRLCVPFNLSGLPAATVPCGFDDDGLPIGLQIAGRAFDEGIVLQLAAAYERATEWHARRPPRLG